MGDAERPREASDPSAPGGLTAVLGTVRMRLVGCEATFVVARASAEADALHLRSVDMLFPGGVVGRSDEADVRVAGPGSEKVSRYHLRIEPVGRQWRIRDLGTRNGTWEPATDGREGWSRLPPNVAIPVSDGWRISLGADVRIAFELVPSAEHGDLTPMLARSPGRTPWEDRIRPVELETFAAALLAGRRLDPRNASAPSIDELAAKLHIARSTAYERLKRLRELPDIASLKHDGDAQGVADALALAYPYLIEE